MLAAGAVALAAAPGTGLTAPQQSILPRDQAARPFAEGRDLVEKGRFRDAVPKLEEALATGHEKPQERFGTSRHAVDYYDPRYWLGVALMELGDEAGALRQLRASAEAAGGLFRDRRETQDRTQRIAELERREAERREPRREPGAAAVPTPTPVAPAPPAPTPAPAAEAAPTPVRTPPLPSPTPFPAIGAGTPLPSPPAARLDEALAALAAGDLAGAAARLDAERRRAPGARELDLVESAVLGAQYVLEGRRDPALLLAARGRLAAFRRKGGSARAEATLLSPSLRALLEPR